MYKYYLKNGPGEGWGSTNITYGIEEFYLLVLNLRFLFKYLDASCSKKCLVENVSLYTNRSVKFIKYALIILLKSVLCLGLLISSGVALAVMYCI